MISTPVFTYILIAYTIFMALVGCANDKADTPVTIPDNIVITAQDKDTVVHPPKN